MRSREQLVKVSTISRREQFFYLLFSVYFAQPSVMATDKS